MAIRKHLRTIAGNKLISHLQRLLVLVVTSCVLVCSGCDSHGLFPTRLQDIDINSAVAAVYLTPQIANYGFHSPSRLAFIFKDGSYRLASAEQMDLGHLSWTQQGLFYSGNDDDTWVTKNGVTKVRSPKIVIDSLHHLSQQDALVSLDQGKHYAMFINGGFLDQEHYTGYKEQFVLVDSKRAKSHTWNAESFVISAAACGSDIYLFQDHDDQQGRRNRIVKIDTRKSFHPVTVTEYRSFLDTEDLFRGASCVADKVVTLSKHSTEGGKEIPNAAGSKVKAAAIGNRAWGYSVPVVNVWDMNQRKHSVHPLLLPNGKSLPISLRNLSGLQYDQQSLQEDELYWMEPLGGLYKTNIWSGTTQKISQIQIPKEWRNAEIKTQFSTGSVFALVVPNNGKNDDCTLEQISLRNGHIIKEIGIKGFGRESSLQSVPRGFAVNPRSSVWK